MTTTDIAKAGGSLAIRPDQTGWTDDQAAVLRQTGISDDVTAAELSGFLHLCQRTQLDPFSRQIYLIGRKDKRANRVVFTPQTGIDGYRVIAHRVIAETREAFGYEDTLWCDSNGQWRDVWLPEAAPSAAKVTVLRNGQRFSAVALYREYAQTDYNGNPTRMWKTMGANQIAKCAEALALRKAFPHDLAGVYTAEEMAQADNPSADERHLRKVEPGQGDPWAGPAAPSEQAPPQWVTDAVRISTDAESATDPAKIRDLYREANGRGLLTATVLIKLGSAEKSMELGAFLTARGNELAEPVPTGPAPYSVSDAVAAEGAMDSTADEGVVDAEVLSPEDDYADAVAQLRAAAADARLENFEEGTERALGMPLADAPVEAIRALTAQIRPAA